MEEFKYDVFISYKHDDIEWVQKELIPRLQEADLKICLDDVEFLAGGAAIVSMQDAVEQSRRTLLVLTNADVPGVIGSVGTLLGDAGVNIAEYHQARLTVGGDALAAVSVDGEITAAVRKKLLALPDVQSATAIDLSALDPAGEQVWS